MLTSEELADLRAKAEAAGEGRHKYDWRQVRAEIALVDAVTPATVLELLDMIEQLQKDQRTNMFPRLQRALEYAREEYPRFGGISCITHKYADLVATERHGDKKEAKKQALYLAVTAIRFWQGDE